MPTSGRQGGEHDCTRARPSRAHNIRQAIEKLAEAVAKRVAKDGYDDAERSGVLAEVSGNTDFGYAITKRIVIETLTDWMLGDLKI